LGKTKLSFLVIGLLLLLFSVAACTASAGPQGPPGPTGPAGPPGPAATVPLAAVSAAVGPESCATCHANAGANHQANYNQLYQDGVIKVTDIKYSFASSPDTTKISFKMTKNGAAFDGRDADSLNLYFVPYTGKTFELGARLSLKGTLSYDGAGVTTSTLVEKAPGTTGYVDYVDEGGVNGILAVYGDDEVLGTIPNTRVSQNKYPFAALLKMGTVNYVSTANNAGCEKCHTTPYLKHGYIYGEVNHDPATDFYVCKVCHLDNGPGGHYEWQLNVNDPPLAQAYLAGTAKLTDAQQAQYAYKTTLMNDVHMSHSMEFPYPQSMSNCVTCHEGKLDSILTDANFKIGTCKSCHAVSGSDKYGTKALALKTILPATVHGSMDLDKVDCTSCHSAGKGAATFKDIHSGYDTQIYTSNGRKYSSVVTVKIDSASVASNKLNIKFSAAENPDLPNIDVAKITPTVLVGLYGYDTKDFIVGPHERLNDDNKDGVVDSKDSRTLEFVVGEKHPRLLTVSAADGKWEVTADLSAWSDLITAKTVKRVEIGIIPTLKTADNMTLALNAPSRTFDLGNNAFDDKFYGPIVKVTDGCNNCHDALGTTFHSPDRGGNVVVCRLCHTTKSGGSHLEMQSRSIDSYVHAIHSFQAFDIGTIDFSDKVLTEEYQLHTETTYPAHGTDCESCHVKGTYNVPDQSKSLPAILSAAATTKNWDRNIGTVPSYVTGPAAKACGGCHRAELINEDAASELASFNQHTKNGGYLIEAGKDPVKTLGGVIDTIMAVFK